MDGADSQIPTPNSCVDAPTYDLLERIEDEIDLKAGADGRSEEKIRWEDAKKALE